MAAQDPDLPAAFHAAQLQLQAQPGSVWQSLQLYVF
jgi:hypothetical protein